MLLTDHSLNNGHVEDVDEELGEDDLEVGLQLRLDVEAVEIGEHGQDGAERHDVPHHVRPERGEELLVVVQTLR